MLSLLRSETVLCAFCRLSHRVYRQKDIGLSEVIIFLAATGVFSILIWQRPDNRSLIFFMVLASSMQIFVRMRWRQSVRCPHCGFDPIVYKRDPENAAAMVKSFLEQRRNDPQYLLKPRPQIKPIVKKTEDWRKNLPVANPASQSEPISGAKTDIII